MSESGLLLWLVLIPIAGAAVGALLPRGGAAKWWALVVTLATTGAALGLATQLNWNAGTELRWGYGLDNPLMIETIGAGVRLGADSVSLWLVLLTVLLMVLSVLASFGSIRQREKEYYAWMLLLLAAMNGVFVARDLLLFYIFFELTLIPMFFIIGIWGGADRRYAAGKFFLFTFAGSVFTLVAIIYLGIASPAGFEMEAALRLPQAWSQQARFWLFLGLLAGFAVKVPLFPVHTWLPLAHTEAPTAGSVILAGVLLKLGTYGIYKLAIPVGAPDITVMLASTIGAIAIVGINYGALVAWVQQDIKKLVAYSSVSHLGFCVLGLFALNTIGMSGAVLYMINHGLSTGALFLVVGMIYDRYHTRDINELSGLGRKMPVLSFFLVLFALSSIGLPGLNGFVNEFLTILGAFMSEHLGIGFAALGALGIILGAVYMLHMVARVVFGPIKVPHAHEHENTGDLSAREIGILVPLALAVVILGVRPNIVLQTIEQPVQAVVQTMDRDVQPALARSDQAEDSVTR